MNIKTKFSIGQIVFLKTDCDQKAMQIVQICIKPEALEYNLKCGTASSWHFEIEITEEKDILKSL